MPGLLTLARKFKTGCAAFMRAQAGNLGIIFGVGAIPVVGVVGLGIDYGIAMNGKVRLDTAADAAALAGAVTAQAFISSSTAITGVTASALTAGINQATNAFNVNAGKVPFAQVTLQTPQVQRVGQTLTSTVSYTATFQNTFGKIFRSPTTTISNTAVASVDLASYLDFYLMVDVSGSMGLPSTTVGMTSLAAINNDMWSDYQQGCQFACHFPGYVGWTKAAGKIQLRSDAVNNAVCALLQRATVTSIQNQYRVGIYPFINQIATLSPISSNISSISSAAQCGQIWPMAFTNLLDTGSTQIYTGNDPSTGTGAGGTHFEVALPQMQTIVAQNGVGDGSSAVSRKPFVFLVTDGMQNSQHFFTWQNGKYTYPGNPSKFSGYSAANWDGSQPAQISSSQCDALKAAGATVAILYIPYNNISFWDNGGGIAWENKRVNALSPSLATPLQACASTGFFYTANSPADITAALGAMFSQALRVARLTQ